MIGETLRYYPICVELKRLLPSGGRVLDVGCSGRGIGLLYRHSFVGLDLHFPASIHRGMTPVAGSAKKLPFGSRSFDVVVCSDVLEHLNAGDRPAAVRELIRVTRMGLILGFPSGEGALESDRFIAGLYEQRGKALPEWLKSHLECGPVDPVQVEAVLAETGTRFRLMENQSVKLGKILARMESGAALKGLSYLLGTLMPRLSGLFLTRFADRKGPFARRIYSVVLPNDAM